MQVDIVVRGIDQERQLLGRLARRLDDGRPQLLGLVDELIAAERQRFAGVGIKWRKLGPRTAREGRRPLVLTGALMRSLTVRGHPDQIVELRPGQLRFGTRIYYARFHQKGIGVPKRTVVGLTRIQRKSVVDELRDLLVGDLA